MRDYFEWYDADTGELLRDFDMMADEYRERKEQEEALKDDSASAVRPSDGS